VTKLPENAYLDFLEHSESQMVKSLFLEEWRSDEPTLYDDENNLTPRFLSDALSTLPDRDSESFSDYYIDDFNRRLQTLIKAGPGRSMNRDLFELYMPTLPKLNFERMPKHPADERRLDPFALTFSTSSDPIDRELNKAIKQISVLKDSHERESRIRRLYAFTETVENLLGAAWRGRRYEIITGLPKLDDWLAEVQTALGEFTLPNGVADELINRKLITNLINEQDYDRLFAIFSQTKDPLIVEMESIPLTTVVGWTGSELVTGITREEAVKLLDAYAVAENKSSRSDGLGANRHFLKPPEVLMAEEKLATFKTLTGFWRNLL